MERILRKTLTNGCFANVTPERSRIMSAIRGKRNKSTELPLRMALVRAGLRGWSSHPDHILGKPDFFFSRRGIAVFVDGCFWHGCRRCGHVPKTNRPFWTAKIIRNRQRDLITSRKLRARHVVVLRFWEHDVKNRLDYCIRRISELMH
jgi:DNA mismatch endonuclease (patch repair protein)